MTLTVGSLFSGIGGIDLGLERAGMTVRWQCESDPYCRKVLAKHWPDVPCHPDVRNLPDDLEPVDLICGGYPCQPFSLAGRRGGADDARHLWPYFADVLRHLRPEWALLENVPGHLGLGFADVLADLAALGFDAEWDSLPAAAFGAPHLRYRLFVVAHAHRQGQPGKPVDALTRPGIVVPDTGSDQLRDQPVTLGRRCCKAIVGDDGPIRHVAHTYDPGLEDRIYAREETTGQARSDAIERRGTNVADTDAIGRHGRSGEFGPRRWAESEDGGDDLANAVIGCSGAEVLGPQADGAESLRSAGWAGRSGWWAVEPDVGRVAHGVPHRVDRLRALGNAVVPQVAEWIGRRIMERAA